MSDPIETKLAAARTRLILDKPFLGALVLRLPLLAADPKWCQTTATDARAFYYNPRYIDALSLDQLQFALAHEALHCALSHFARRQGRIKHRWDVACDYAINPLLVGDGLKPPPGALLQESYEGMTAEEIYPYIKENTDEEPQDRHLYDDDQKDDRDRQQDQGQDGESPQSSEPDKNDERSGQSPSVTPYDEDHQTPGAPQPQPLSESEREQLSIQWQQRLAGAAQQALQAGKMGTVMARIVDHLLQPRLPWRMLLARYMTALARDDYSFTRPSNRREGAAILPSLRSTQLDLTVILDTSGSISDEEMHEFLSEIDAIKGQMRARITLHACDDQLAESGPWTYEAWEELTLPPDIEGGGATSFIPAFDWAEHLDRPPNLCLYFTDAEGEFPAQEPPFPVLWLVKGKLPVPWGQRIQLN